MLETFKGKKTDGKAEKKSLFHKASIIKLIAENAACTIGDIAKNLSISLPTANNLMNELLEEDVTQLAEKGESIGGRKPNLYRLHDGLFHVLCVEMQRFSMMISLVDNNQNIIAPLVEVKNEISRDARNIEKVLEIIDQYIKDNNISVKQLTGIAVSMPGLINTDTGTNETFLHHREQSVISYFEAHYNKTTYIVNDVKGAAYAELKFGLAKNTKNSLVILMDWGIGLGIISDGQIYQGHNGYSGEVGHMPFIDNGELCYCGKRGCLETVASGIALVQRAQTDIKRGEQTLLKTSSDVELQLLSPSQIITAANQGDQFAINLVSHLGTNLGKAFASLIQLFNPERIILGGKIAKAGDLITTPIRQAIQAYTMFNLRENCKVMVSDLDLDTNTIGLSNYFIERYIQTELLDKIGV